MRVRNSRFGVKFDFRPLCAFGNRRAGQPTNSALRDSTRNKLWESAEILIIRADLGGAPCGAGSGFGGEAAGGLGGEGGNVFEHFSGERAVEKSQAELIFDEDKNPEEAQRVEPELLERRGGGDVGNLREHAGDFGEECAFDFTGGGSVRHDGGQL